MKTRDIFAGILVATSNRSTHLVQFIVSYVLYIMIDSKQDERYKELLYVFAMVHLICYSLGSYGLSLSKHYRTLKLMINFSNSLLYQATIFYGLT